jgi:hypothetical protein
LRKIAQKSIRICKAIWKILLEIKDQYYNMKEKIVKVNILLILPKNERSQHQTLDKTYPWRTDGWSSWVTLSNILQAGTIFMVV